MADGLEVTIERDGCISCAACWTVCPELFEESPDNALSQVVEQYRIGGDKGRGTAPAELEDKLRDAADACPTSVIHV